MTQPAGGTAPRPLIHQHGVRLSALARGRPTQWRSLDIVTGAVLGVAFGVAFWGFDSFVYTPLSTALSFLPPLKELLLGVWLLPCVAGMLIIRRPGAALLVEMVAASIEALLGNYWGLTVLISGLLQALGVELVAAVLRWRRFDLTMAVLGGIMAAVLEILAYEWWFMVPEYSWTWKLLYLAAGILSGAVIAGVGGHLLVKALAATGSLNAFPPGEDHLRAGGEPLHDAFPAAG
ncbi:MAG: ECF transporter S component [Austwickia sp.]|jgi:energy-coupling factor transport system substrate-specific component|nr:ECF transporter S component [Austwickia sp.]MBK8437618.1 ECF transporter S component [Austwickia sp.]MBK9102934.1 ECF transporter S component [Austwickia sp.]